jgi:hypothetical protein
MYACQISKAAVTALKNTGAAHCRFNGYQYVVTVNDNGLPAKVGEFDFTAPSGY